MPVSPRGVLQHYGLKIAEEMGSEARCLCPFHEDHNPSFDMNLDRGVWVCRAGCGGGGLEQFVMRMDKVPYAIAKALLANDFVLFEGSREHEFLRVYAEVTKGRDEDAPIVGDEKAKNVIIGLILRDLKTYVNLSQEFVNRWIRVLIFVLGDKETHPTNVYENLYKQFTASIIEEGEHNVIG
jgi:hypothetical protein